MSISVASLLTIFAALPAKEIFGQVSMFILEHTGTGRDLFSMVEDAVEDGKLTPEEAVDIGYAVSDAVGNIQVKIKGRDVIRTQAQREIFGALGRIARQVLIARGRITVD